MIKSNINKLSHDIITNIISNGIINKTSYILKELLENSCDALSTKIHIYINLQNNSIKIIDNGCGIYKNDLYKSILQYNTSKIKTKTDLNNIHFYGFKGEGLFLIKSISNIEITSKPFDQHIAWQIKCNKYSNNIAIEPTTRSNGTTVYIKNMNIDDKKLSLKYRYKKIYDVFKIIALSNFNIHFVLYKNNIEILTLPICNCNTSKINRIKKLTSKNTFMKSINLNYKNNNFKLTGFIYNNNNNIFKFFFINKRCVTFNLFTDIFNNIFIKNQTTKSNLSYCLYLTINFNLFKFLYNLSTNTFIYLKPNKLYTFLYDSLFNTAHKYTDFFLSLKNQNNYLKKNDECLNNFYLLNNNTNNELFFNTNKILTILNNIAVFFEINNKIFVINLVKIRSKFISDICIKQFSNNGKIISKKINCFKNYNIKKKYSIIYYKAFFSLYGFKIKKGNGTDFFISSIPEILFNYLINWDFLFYDLFKYFDKNMIENLSHNRINVNVINILIKNIYKKSPCYLSEITILYNYLCLLQKNNEKWFLTNCFEVSYRKI